MNVNFRLSVKRRKVDYNNVKICSKCKVNPALSQSKLCSGCKKERKAYDKDYFREHAKEKTANAIETKKSLLARYRALKHGKICMACGGGPYHFCILDFDHLPGHRKVMDVSRMVRLGYAWEKVVEEINKCQLICSNCHRLRTFFRRMGKEVPNGLF